MNVSLIQELWLWYLMIGVILAWMSEILANHLEKQLKKYDLTKDLTWGVRIVGILLWPYLLVVFLINYYKAKNRN